MTEKPVWEPDGKPTFIHEHTGDAAWVMVRKADRWCVEHGMNEYTYDCVQFLRPESITKEKFLEDFPEGQQVPDGFKVGVIEHGGDAVN